MGPSELWTGQGFASWMTFIKFILRLGGVGHHLYRGPEVSTSYSAAYWSLTWLRDSAQESQQSHLWHPNTSKLCKGEAAWLRTGLECLRVGDVFVHGDWCLCVFVPSIQFGINWFTAIVLFQCGSYSNDMFCFPWCCHFAGHEMAWITSHFVVLHGITQVLGWPEKLFHSPQKVSGFRWPVGGGRSSQIYLTQGPAFLQSW